MNPQINPEDIFDVRKAQLENMLFCPDCYQQEGLLIPFKFWNCTTKVKHFHHYDPETQKRSDCAGSSPESQKHLSAKRAVFDSLIAREGIADVKYEFPLFKDGVKSRRPDIIALYPNGATVAVEIQISPIYPDQLQERIQDAKLHGIGSIEWYMYGKNYSIANRKACLELGVRCFKLSFQDGDDNKPRWELDQEIGGIVAKEREEEKKIRLKQEKCRLEQERRTAIRSQSESIADIFASRKIVLVKDAVKTSSVKPDDRLLELCQWLLSLKDEELPDCPFYLAPHIQVTGEKFIAHLRSECSVVVSGGRTPRQFTGGLLKELELLAKIVG